jgi:hypothetical protein
MRIVAFGLAILLVAGTSAAAERKLVGTYRWVERVAADGHATLREPDVAGSMTFSKSKRTVIMGWRGADGTQTAIAVIASYTLTGGKYCETEEYGMQSNLGAPGVAYDQPATAPVCTAAISDATGLSFEIPGEKLRLQITRDGIRVTTPTHTDRWERVR